jgi:hypothetical protein
MRPGAKSGVLAMKGCVAYLIVRRTAELKQED